MSVINSMLRDLDRRHAPLPAKTHAQPTFVQAHRAWPRSAFALCALIVVGMWSWGQRSQQTTAKPADVPAMAASIIEPPAKTVAVTALKSPLPARVGKGEGEQRTEISDTSTSSSRIGVIEKEPKAKPALTPVPLAREEGIRARENNSHAIVEQPAPIIKQERAIPNSLNDERYRLARAALAQNQAQRAYELLRDNTPPIASATDYHAVLAAVEQQLGHYADAGLRYQQLLMLDQNQASWWLGFALSLEGEQRNSEALAAYQRAAALNSLPDAARQYVTTRIAALSTTSGQIVKAEH